MNEKKIWVRISVLGSDVGACASLKQLTDEVNLNYRTVMNYRKGEKEDFTIYSKNAGFRFVRVSVTVNSERAKNFKR